MDKQEALRLFIKRNSNEFELDPFPYDAFKEEKRKFFIEEHKVGAVTNSEIARAMLDMLIDKSQIKDEKQLQAKFLKQFYNDNIQNKEHYKQKLALKLAKADQSVIDIAKLKEEETRRKIVEEYKEQARKEFFEQKQAEIEEIENKIKAKQEEYDSLPSILDSSQYDKITPQTPVPESGGQTQFPLWWQNVGLSKNPFPDDLSDPSYNSVFQDIIQKTSIYLKYDEITKVYPREIFRNIMFFGDFGSGKTTFFEYLGLKLISSKIQSVRIRLYGDFDIFGIIFDYKKKLLSELSKVYHIQTGQRPSFLNPSDIDEQINQILYDLSGKHGIRGFVIFIDDLHKAQNLDNVFKFLSLLQITRDDLKQKLPSVSIAFYIAGSPDMEKKISSDQKYSGSIDHSEPMPAITADTAQSAINKRLRKFSLNQENPRQVDRLLIETIMKNIESNGQPFTFRTLIHATRSEFEAGHFTGLTADPISVLDSTLQSIKQHIESNPVARSEIYRFLRSLSKDLTDQQKNYCLRLLVNIYRKGGLSNEDIKEEDAKYLKRLGDATLIIKTTENGKLVWRISHTLAFVNKQIINRFGLSLEDYLLHIYGSQSAALKPQSTHKDMDIIDELLQNLPRGPPYEELMLARKNHLEVLENKQKYLDEESEFPKITKILSTALAALTRSYVLWERLPNQIDNDDDTLVFWKEFWFSPDILEVYFRVKYDVEVEKKKRIHHLVSLYLETFPELLNFFKSQIEKSRLIRIPLVDLKNEEISSLNVCIDEWLAKEDYKSAERAYSAIDEKLSRLLLNIFTLLYGDREARLRMLGEFNRYIEVDAPETEEENEFLGLRDYYKKLMTGIDDSTLGRQHWTYIFKEIFRPWNEREFGDFLDLLVRMRLLTSRNKDQKISSEEHQSILDFIARSTDFMVKVNRSYTLLLKPKYFKRTESMDVIFSLCDFKDQAISTPIQLDTNTENQLWVVTKDKWIFRCPLELQDYISGNFNSDYRTFYAYLATMLNPTEDYIRKHQKKIVMKSAKGSDIVCYTEEIPLEVENKQEAEVPQSIPSYLRSMLIEQLLKEEEGSHLEFKSSLRHIYKLPFDVIAIQRQLNTESDQKQRSHLEQAMNKKIKEIKQNLEHGIIKTMAAFLNSDGGILIVGYDDDNKVIVGLQDDYNTFEEKKNWDIWLQHLTNLMIERMGMVVVNSIIVDHENIGDKTLARITVNKSSRPVYLKSSNDRQFYIRIYNNTRQLNIEEALEYISRHWK